jgi:hypothetical protein
MAAGREFMPRMLDIAQPRDPTRNRCDDRDRQKDAPRIRPAVTASQRVVSTGLFGRRPIW